MKERVTSILKEIWVCVKNAGKQMFKNDATVMCLFYWKLCKYISIKTAAFENLEMNFSNPFKNPQVKHFSGVWTHLLNIIPCNISHLVCENSWGTTRNVEASGRISANWLAEMGMETSKQSCWDILSCGLLVGFGFRGQWVKPSKAMSWTCKQTLNFFF